MFGSKKEPLVLGGSISLVAESQSPVTFPSNPVFDVKSNILDTAIGASRLVYAAEVLAKNPNTNKEEKTDTPSTEEQPHKD